MNIELTTRTENCDFQTEYAALLGEEFHNFTLSKVDGNCIRFDVKRFPKSRIAENIWENHEKESDTDSMTAQLSICVSRDETFLCLSVSPKGDRRRRYSIQASREEVIQFADKYINRLDPVYVFNYERWARPQTLEDALKVLRQY